MNRPTPSPKKPYTAPRLRRYGDLRRITLGGTKTRQEGGGNPAVKTKGGTG